MALDSSKRPKEYLSIMDAERMVAKGLAIFFPAISGAEPWLGSYNPNLESFMLAEAIRRISNEESISAMFNA